jgi:general secretion pathway protein C
MNIVSNKYYTKLITSFLIWVIVLKILNITAIYFLPKHSIYKVPAGSLDLPYFSLRLDKSFGEKRKNENKIEPIKEQYHITDLVLKAIYGSSSNKNQSFIMVVKKNKKETNLLSMGDVIKGYKFIDIKIEEKEAIFEKNNKIYTLQIDKIKDKKNQKIKKYNSHNNKKIKQNTDDVILAVPKGEILKYRNNFKKIWKNISIKEVKKKGKINGFLITRIKPGTIFSKLGLKEGDIIKELNNNKIKSYAEAFKIYYKIDRMRALKITILRNKVQKDIEYEIY